MAAEVVADSSAGPPAKKRWTAAEVVKELTDLSVLLAGGLVSREKHATSKSKSCCRALETSCGQHVSTSASPHMTNSNVYGQDVPIIRNHCQISHVCAFAQQIPTSTALKYVMVYTVSASGAPSTSEFLVRMRTHERSDNDCK